MSEQKSMIGKVAEDAAAVDNNTNSTNTEAVECAAAGRKERRKAAKRDKRKNKRKEMAEMARREEEARLNDPEEQLRLQAEEEQEKLRVEKERREFEERERKILEEWEIRKALEEKEEEERRRAQEEENQSKVEHENEMDEDGWEYVEEGPPEIIWQGNEIIVKKKRIRVKKKDTDLQIVNEDPIRPTSNPLPPQSEVYADHKNSSTLSAQQLLENVAQETPNFGTEQDKAHCPFHLKTGACRFGSHCSRIHFYPDKSCTLLIKNMYNGPGLAWEQDEGLEHTDEEVERSYEEFYEDVHTEFLKFGEIVNFKVCRNGSSHLRGNVYVHYKSLDSAVLSHQSVNGRYFAGKQLQCEFVGVTRWKVAICGEFMKSKLKSCSRGMTCNFIHCFRNPGGDYEWADWDKPPPSYWQRRMAALFGYSDELVHDRKIERGSRSFRNSRRTLADDADRSQSRDTDFSRSSRNYTEDDARKSEPRRHHRSSDRKHSKDVNDEQYVDSPNSREKRHRYSSIDRKTDRSRLDEKGSRHSRYESSNLSPDNHHHGHSRRSTREKSGHSTCPSAAGERKKMRTSPDDRWDFRGATCDTDSAGDWSDGERQIARIHREESPRSDGSEESEHKRSKKRRHTHKPKISTIRDHLDREAERDIESPSNSVSSSKYYSRRDGRKSERGETGERFHDDHPGRIQCHEAMRSLATENRIEVDIDDRGRWDT